MPCVPCEEKKKLNQRSQQAVDSGEKMRRKVEKLHAKGKIDDDQAASILEPYMVADRRFIETAGQAAEIATERLAAATE